MCKCLLICTCLITACSAISHHGDKPNADSFITLTILSTNDFHGAFGGVRDRSLAGQSEWLGGIEYLATAIKQVRASARGPVLLVDAGDCFQGPPAVNMSEGAICFDMFSLLKYDVVGLGNHEFDYGDCGPNVVAGNDPQCALRKRVRESRVPVVCANVLEKETGLPVAGVARYAVIEKEGLKIGVTGVVPQDTPMISSPGGTRGLEFLDPVEAIAQVLPAMKAEGANVIVVLAHLDGECEGGEAVQPCEIRGLLGRIVRAFAPGTVDVVIAGHSHVLIASVSNGIAVVEAMAQGRFLGHVEVKVNKKSGRPEPAGINVLPPIPICRSEDPFSKVCHRGFSGFAGAFPADREATVFRNDRESEAMALCDYEVAVLTEDILHERARESPLANLTADLLRFSPVLLGEEPADAAFINQGAIRDSLYAGRVTMCDLYRVWPFEDTLVEARLSGAKIREIFQFVFRGLGKWFAVSGLRIVVHMGPGTVEVLDEDGKPLEDSRIYRVITTSYLAGGGDKMDRFLVEFQTLPFPNKRDAFRDLLKRWSPVRSPGLGRVKIAQ